MQAHRREPGIAAGTSHFFPEEPAWHVHSCFAENCAYFLQAQLVSKAGAVKRTASHNLTP